MNNMGVETRKTYSADKVIHSPSALIDWCEWTDSGVSVDEVCSRLGGEWSEMGYGAKRYRQSRRMGPLLILYQGIHAGMGVHVEAKGEGCRWLEARTIGTAWPAFLGHVSSGTRSLSRLDVALDDREGRLSVQQCVSAADAGDAVMRWKGYNVHRGNRSTGEPKGTTLYLGSPKSNAQMRIYDKAAEQGVPGPWTRVELMLRDDRAMMLARRLAEKGMGAAAAVIRSYLDFRPSSSGRDRERHRTAPWWGAFLRWVEAQPLGAWPLPPRTVELMVERVEAQYGPSLGVITDVLGLEALIDITDRARPRWGADHCRIAADR